MANFTPDGIAPCCEYLFVVKTRSLVEYSSDPRVIDLIKKHKVGDFEVLPDKCKECIVSGNNRRYGPVDNNHNLVDLNLTIDYDCGFDCIMCYSTKKKRKALDAYGDDHLDFKYIINNEDKSDYLDNDYSGVKRVTLAGGDPAMIKLYPKILEKIDASAELTYHYNGDSVAVTKRNSLLKELSRFKNLDLVVSLDGDLSFNEYHRVGFKKDNFLANLKKVEETLNPRSFTILFTVTSLSLFRVIDFVKELSVTPQLKKYSVVYHCCISPEQYNPRNLPRSLKMLAIKKISTLGDSELITVMRDMIMGSGNTLYFKKLMVELDKRELYYNHCVNDYVPEIRRYRSE